MAETRDEVLVATDDSAAARAAALLGIRLAMSEGLRVHGLYVVDEALSLDPYAEVDRELKIGSQILSRADLLHEFELQGQRALRWLTARCEEVRVPARTEIIVGGVPELLLQKAASARALTIGRRGRGQAGRVGRLGSTFHAVVHRLEVPVLIGGEEERPLRRLLLAYDGSPRAQEGLKWAAKLQQSLSLELAVVAVQDKGQEPVEDWLQEARDALGQDRQVRLLPASGTAGDAIVTTAQEQQSDLIIMGRYHHGLLHESLVGSTGARILRGSEIAVFMV